MEKNANKSPDLKDYFGFGPVFHYFFRRKDPEHRPNFSLRVMHGINKISIIIFLLAIIYLVSKYVF